MPESMRSKCKRILFNFFPAYRGTGGRITYISDDFREVRIRLPLNWRTRNYVGTIFGGSMYSSMDPIYMIMLIHVLGPEYVVWDKSASIRFRKPGRRTLFSSFVLTEENVRDIRRELEVASSLTRLYTADLTDVEGTVHATIEKTIYIGRKDKLPALGKNSEPRKEP